MEYTLHLAEPYGEIFPLYTVAEELAWRFATAGNTACHKPTFWPRRRVC